MDKHPRAGACYATRTNPDRSWFTYYLGLLLTELII